MHEPAVSLRKDAFRPSSTHSWRRKRQRFKKRTGIFVAFQPASLTSLDDSLVNLPAGVIELFVLLGSGRSARRQSAVRLSLVKLFGRAHGPGPRRFWMRDLAWFRRALMACIRRCSPRQYAILPQHLTDELRRQRPGRWGRSSSILVVTSRRIVLRSNELAGDRRRPRRRVGLSAKS